MTSWKIHHEWVDVFSIENEDFPACHVSFQGCSIYNILVGGSNIFYFHPEPLGKPSNLTSAYIFQMGWWTTTTYCWWVHKSCTIPRMIGYPIVFFGVLGTIQTVVGNGISEPSVQGRFGGPTRLPWGSRSDNGDHRWVPFRAPGKARFEFEKNLEGWGQLSK